MVKISKYFLYTIFFLFALISLLPKENIYFYAEDKLKEQGVIISSEKVEDNLVELAVNDASISYRSIDSAYVKSCSINTLLFYNSVHINKIKLDNALSSFVPQNIDDAVLTYSLIDPLNVNIKASGEFGSLYATLNIASKHLEITLLPSKLMKSKYKKSLRYFKKQSNGEYKYDQNI